MFSPVKVGNNYRYSYARIKEVMKMPHLLDIQINSYNWFIEEGLGDILRDISPITDFTGNLELFFKDFSIGEPKYSLAECRERDVTYAAPVRVNVQLVNKEQGGGVIDQEVFMGDFPLMTSTGTFIINGAERVIVSQLVRSPGAYFEKSIDTSGHPLFKATLIPNRGAWLEFETDSSDSISVRIDRTRKLPIIYLLRALGFEDDEFLLQLFDYDERIKFAIDEHIQAHHPEEDNRDNALKEIYKRLRPGEPATSESASQLLHAMFKDTKRYDLATVGRYKFTNKLGWRNRLEGLTLAEPFVDNETGEILLPANVELTDEMIAAIKIDNEMETFDLNDEMPIKLKVFNPNNSEKIIPMLCTPALDEKDDRTLMISDVLSAISYLLNLMDGIGKVDDIDHLGNRRVRAVGELLQNQYRIGMTRMERVVRERMTTAAAEIITPQSLINIRPIVAAMKEFFGSSQLSQFMDQHNPLSELTHKRRLSALGPGGLSRERAGFEVRDVHNSHYGRMCPIETPEGPNIGLIGSLSNYGRVNRYGFIETPYRIVDKINKTVTNEVIYLTADKEQKASIASANEPLDQNNWFKNARVTARVNEQTVLINADTVDYMDVSPKQVVSIATAMIPFLEHDDANRALMGANMQRQAVPLLRTASPLVGTGMEFKAARDSGVMPLAKLNGKVVYIDANFIVEEIDPIYKTEIIQFFDPKFNADRDKILFRDETGEIIYNAVDVMDDSTLNRLQHPKIKKTKIFSNDKDAVDVITFDGKLSLCYRLNKFARSNQGTCFNHVPIVDLGDHLTIMQPIADGPATHEGELALGYNIIVAYMPWEGYNYEDAILLSENLVKRDIYTSIHIEEYECEARDTKLGSEDITRDIPNISEDVLKDLDADGVIRVGADVRPGDILVGKVTPKGETELTAEERLLRAIFGEKAREVRDSSLRVPHGEAGKIVAIKHFDRESNEELSPGVNHLVRIYIAQKRKISVGDKMSGRHGNKGVVSRIMREEDMPFLPDGTPVDIVLNPLGVPSRMNIGQILETHLGMAAREIGKSLKTSKANEIIDSLSSLVGYDPSNGIPKAGEDGLHISTPVFDGASEQDVINTMIAAGMDRTGKTTLYDGRTGEPFENPVTVGCVYMLKLHHLVDDKIHARSTGPYSLVTQQPLGGKAQFGGQRFGEMEVWALEAYGAAYTLQEILTVKSDDVVGRVKAYEAIVKGENIPEPGVPESFKVLIKELQSIALDVKVLSADAKEINIQDEEEDDDLPIKIKPATVAVDPANMITYEEGKEPGDIEQTYSTAADLPIEEIAESEESTDPEKIFENEEETDKDDLDDLSDDLFFTQLNNIEDYIDSLDADIDPDSEDFRDLDQKSNSDDDPDVSDVLNNINFDDHFDDDE